MLAEGMVRTWCFMSLVTLLVGGVGQLWSGMGITLSTVLRVESFTAPRMAPL